MLYVAVKIFFMIAVLSSLTFAEIKTEDLGVHHLKEGLVGRLYKSSLTGSETYSQRLSYLANMKYLTDGELIAQRAITSFTSYRVKNKMNEMFGFYYDPDYSELILELRGYIKAPASGIPTIGTNIYVTLGCENKYVYQSATHYWALNNGLYLNSTSDGRSICTYDTTVEYVELMRSGESTTDTNVGGNMYMNTMNWQEGQYYPIVFRSRISGDAFRNNWVIKMDNIQYALDFITFYDPQEDYVANDANHYAQFPGRCPQFHSESFADTTFFIPTSTVPNGCVTPTPSSSTTSSIVSSVITSSVESSTDSSTVLSSIEESSIVLSSTVLSSTVLSSIEVSSTDVSSTEESSIIVSSSIISSSIESDSVISSLVEVSTFVTSSILSSSTESSPVISSNVVTSSIVTNSIASSSGEFSSIVSSDMAFSSIESSVTVSKTVSLSSAVSSPVISNPVISSAIYSSSDFPDIISSSIFVSVPIESSNSPCSSDKTVSTVSSNQYKSSSASISSFTSSVNEWQHSSKGISSSTSHSITASDDTTQDPSVEASYITTISFSSTGVRPIIVNSESNTGEKTSIPVESIVASSKSTALTSESSVANLSSSVGGSNSGSIISTITVTLPDVETSRTTTCPDSQILPSTVVANSQNRKSKPEQIGEATGSRLHGPTTVLNVQTTTDSNGDIVTYTTSITSGPEKGIYSTAVVSTSPSKHTDDQAVAVQQPSGSAISSPSSSVQPYVVHSTTASVQPFSDAGHISGYNTLLFVLTLLLSLV